MKILAIGAHTDDVELGCGGMLAKHASAGEKWMTFFLSQNRNDGIRIGVAYAELFERVKYLA